jgi:hypothetical protein
MLLHGIIYCTISYTVISTSNAQLQRIYVHIYIYTHTRARARTCAHARTHAHTHTHIFIYLFIKIKVPPIVIIQNYHYTSFKVSILLSVLDHQSVGKNCCVKQEALNISVNLRYLQYECVNIKCRHLD